MNEVFENQSAIQSLLSKVEKLNAAINLEFKEESQSVFSFFEKVISIIPSEKEFNEIKNKILNQYKLVLKQDHRGENKLSVVLSFIAKYESTLNQIKDLLKKFNKDDDKDFKRLNKFKTHVDAIRGDLKLYEDSQTAVIYQELAMLLNELAIEKENIKQKLVQEITLGVERRMFASYYQGQSASVCKEIPSDSEVSNIKKQIAIKKEELSSSDCTKFIEYFENEIVDFDKNISERMSFIHDQIIEVQMKSIQLDYQFHRASLDNYCQENQVKMSDVLLFRLKMRDLKILLLQFEKDFMLDHMDRAKSEKDQISLNNYYKENKAVLPVTQDLSLKNMEGYLEEDFKAYIKDAIEKEFSRLHKDTQSYEERHATLPYFNVFEKKWLSYFQYRINQLIYKNDCVLKNFVLELTLDDECTKKLVK